MIFCAVFSAKLSQKIFSQISYLCPQCNYALKVTDEFKNMAFFSEMQSYDQEVFKKVDFVDESGADFGGTVAEESDTEEAQEGTNN